MDFDILKLAELCNPKRSDASDSEDELGDENQGYHGKGLTPGDIGQRKPSVYDKQKLPEEQKEAVILDAANADALCFSEESGAEADWRKIPQWDVSYKQQVTPSDVFLQMSGKSSSTSSCEDIILKIHLPEEDHRNVDLKVTKCHIKLLSPKYRLEVPLPQPVDPQCGNAKWDQDAEQLIVTLRMNREFDFINF